MKKVISITSVVIVVLLVLFYWQRYLNTNHPIVIYFGRPFDVYLYISQNWGRILEASFTTTLIAVTSLFLAGLTALYFLIMGLISDKWLQRVEQLVAISQTIPILVIVTIIYIAQKSIFKALNVELGLAWYCFMPVCIALFFPPLVYGIKGVRSIDSDMKALLRIWDAPQSWRIRRIYLPQALPHLLTGLRVSSTWAVAATLITEGLVHGVGNNQSSIGKSLMRPFSGSVSPGQTLALMIVATLLGYFVYLLIGIFQSLVEHKYFGIAAKNEEVYPTS